MRKMRKLSFRLLILLLAVFSVSLTSVLAESTDTTVTANTTSVQKKKKGLVQENGKYYYYKNGKKVKSKWVSIKVKSGGKTMTYQYYFQKDGSACTTVTKIGKTYYCFASSGRLICYKKNRLVTRGKYQYCPDKKGVCQTGWILISGKMYYANAKGRIVKSKTVNGIKLDKDGKAVSSLDMKLKKEALSVTAKITNSDMTKSQKLRACWNYVVSNRFRYYSMSPNLNEKGWQKKFAYNMLITKRGSCTSFACAFAALASAVGYKPVIVYGRVPGSRDRAADGYTRHCWVKINGLYYDPEAQFAGWMTGVYGYSYYPISYQVTTTLSFE